MDGIGKVERRFSQMLCLRKESKKKNWKKEN